VVILPRYALTSDNTQTNICWNGKLFLKVSWRVAMVIFSAWIENDLIVFRTKGVANLLRVPAEKAEVQRAVDFSTINGRSRI